jgi:hypothetical protein
MNLAGTLSAISLLLLAGLGIAGAVLMGLSHRDDHPEEPDGPDD